MLAASASARAILSCALLSTPLSRYPGCSQMERRAVVRMQEVDTPMKPDFKVAKPRNGNGRPKFVLNNPQYVVRIAPPPAPPPSPPAWTPRPSAPPRRADGPPAAADFSDVSSAPSEPSADDGPVRDGKSQPRRLNQKAGKSGPVNDGEGGPKTKGVNKRGKGGRRGGMYEYNEATERAVRPSKKGGKKRQVVEVVEKGPIRVKLTGPITVGDLAAELEVGAAMVVKDLMKMGVMASMTQSIDVETAVTIAEGFGAEVTRPGEGDDDEVEDTLAASLPGVVEEEDDPADLQPRPPIVTVMGHVDHGKTSLLDALRSTDGRTIDVASGEAGGITQHIGAYALSLEAGNVTVLDTPGHAAFSQMRSRGANLTDVVILVVAADDGVKEQTVTSINAAKAAGVPIVVAINKIDKPGADPNVVKQGLLQHEVVLEEFGGDVLSAQVSAKTGEGLDTLLDQVLLQSSLLELKANPNRLATGIVLEARNAQGQGAVATALVQKGTLHVGDIVVAGSQWGRVRAILDERATRLNEAGPSAAVEVVGLGGLPNAGDVFTVTTDESAARETAAVRQQLERERKASQLFAARTTGGLDLFLNGKASDELPLKVLDFVVKADVQGSAQALSTAIAELSAADDKLQVRTRVLRDGAGEVTSEDVMLASVSAAKVIGFNVGASRQTADEAAKLNIEIKEYSIVYDVIDDINDMMAQLIRPPPSKALGALVGTADVLQVFKIGAVGKVAGLRVLDGYVRVGCNIRILRGNQIMYEGKLQSLRSGKDEVQQVDAGNECGTSFTDFQAMEVDDRIEMYAAAEGGGADDDANDD